MVLESRVFLFFLFLVFYISNVHFGFQNKPILQSQRPAQVGIFTKCKEMPKQVKGREYYTRQYCYLPIQILNKFTMTAYNIQELYH